MSLQEKLCGNVVTVVLALNDPKGLYNYNHAFTRRRRGWTTTSCSGLLFVHNKQYYIITDGNIFTPYLRAEDRDRVLTARKESPSNTSSKEDDCGLGTIGLEGINGWNDESNPMYTITMQIPSKREKYDGLCLNHFRCKLCSVYHFKSLQQSLYCAEKQSDAASIGYLPFLLDMTRNEYQLPFQLRLGLFALLRVNASHHSYLDQLIRESRFSVINIEQLCEKMRYVPSLPSFLPSHQNSSLTKQGDTIYSISNPFGTLCPEVLNNTYCHGVVSNVHVYKPQSNSSKVFDKDARMYLSDMKYLAGMEGGIVLDKKMDSLIGLLSLPLSFKHKTTRNHASSANHDNNEDRPFVVKEKDIDTFNIVNASSLCTIFPLQLMFEHWIWPLLHYQYQHPHLYSQRHFANSGFPHSTSSFLDNNTDPVSSQTRSLFNPTGLFRHSLHDLSNLQKDKDVSEIEHKMAKYIVPIGIGSHWGTGIIIARGGHILTNAHTVRSYLVNESAQDLATRIRLKDGYKVKVGIHSRKYPPSNRQVDDRTWFNADIKYISAGNSPWDLLWLQISSKNQRYPDMHLEWHDHFGITLPSKHHFQQIVSNYFSTNVFAIGFPLFTPELGLRRILTSGVISRAIFDENNECVCLRTSCSIHSGHSGGVICDEHGNWLGVITSNVVFDPSPLYYYDTWEKQHLLQSNFHHYKHHFQETNEKRLKTAKQDIEKLLSDPGLQMDRMLHPTLNQSIPFNVVLPFVQTIQQFYQAINPSSVSLYEDKLMEMLVPILKNLDQPNDNIDKVWSLQNREDWFQEQWFEQKLKNYVNKIPKQLLKSKI
ncbi:hypothetical protein RFI_09932 [Reticulomyxa filosa]|uniref:Uncharacterized protein n=1 Tax=Reticulomyxa filosa TaxID=46433 RepID=X6NLN3_RETFI|nr:hypothetical protein RFI_09932 [Reticulomyxa filosa]|eukprot:ETO27200.1 hypothetical protein RFI_09932 [Reticulomyxa filosa]